MGGAGAGAVGSVICSICYEDLKPAVEDLQAISVCGHVFHELCLQQWFEYCSNKKNSCPICKQNCTLKQAGRLYFQSVGDNSTDSKKIPGGGCGAHECPELQNEVKRLELKVSALTSTLEHHQKSLKDVNEELCTYKDLAKKESALKVEALQQQALLQQSLHCKSEDLNRSTAVCTKLQERNMALAKELAAIKLVTDLDLKEDEALKLASLGNGGNLKDTIDTLRKSLVIRNKSYKELMIKCNLLGRGEARSNMKLEKAMDKISKLQTRVQQLERAIEIKDNDTIRRVQKASELSMHKMDTDGVSHRNSMLSKKKKLCDSPLKAFSGEHLGTEATLHLKVEYSHNSENTSLSNKQTASFIVIEDDDISITDKKEKDLSKLMSPGHEDETSSCQNNKNLFKDADAFTTNDSKNASLQFGDIVHVQPSVHIRNENSSSSMFAQPVTEQLYSSGLLGPDGVNRAFGKWCKKAHRVESNPVPVSMQGGTRAATGSLISVGADGRGGKIKVLKSFHQTLDTRGSSTCFKRQKQGTKTSSNNVQSNGCLQIEHFFGKSG